MIGSLFAAQSTATQHINCPCEHKMSKKLHQQAIQLKVQGRLVLRMSKDRKPPKCHILTILSIKSQSPTMLGTQSQPQSNMSFAYLKSHHTTCIILYTFISMRRILYHPCPHEIHPPIKFLTLPSELSTFPSEPQSNIPQQVTL
ncbi:hypothetical protein P8452_03499 [Trifolium repens]|nr:hypothetical protein P8452_03499 [Trifolium repens]